jgi:CBS domain-containing protein
VLVVDDGRLLGLMSLSDAKEVRPEAWGQTPIARVMTKPPLKRVSSDAVLSDALKLLAEGSLNQLPVVDGGRVVGLLSRADVLRFLQLRDELDFEIERGQGRRPPFFGRGPRAGRQAA